MPYYYDRHACSKNKSQKNHGICQQCEACIDWKNLGGTVCGQCEDLQCDECTREVEPCYRCCFNNDGNKVNTSLSSSSLPRSPPLPQISTCCPGCQVACPGCYKSFHSICLTEHIQTCRTYHIRSSAGRMKETTPTKKLVQRTLTRLQDQMIRLQTDLALAQGDTACDARPLKLFLQQPQQRQEEEELEATKLFYNDFPLAGDQGHKLQFVSTMF